MGEEPEPIIWSNHKTGNTSHHNTQGDQIISKEIELKKGRYYYMELYHTKFRGSYYREYSDYLQISVEVPNNDPKKLGNIFAVHKFNTSFTPEP